MKSLKKRKLIQSQLQHVHLAKSARIESPVVPGSSGQRKCGAQDEGEEMETTTGDVDGWASGSRWEQKRMEPQPGGPLDSFPNSQH